MKPEDLYKSCSKIAKMYGGKLKIFKNKGDTVRVYKFPSADGMQFIGFKNNNLTVGEPTYVGTVIKHNPTKSTKIDKYGICTITNRPGLKV